MKTSPPKSSVQVLKIFCSNDGIAKAGNVIANKVFLNNAR
jgi:hypothetical protein